MKKFYVLLHLDNDKKMNIMIEKNAKMNAINYLQSQKWVKDEDLDIYYNMDKVLSFQVYDEQ